MNTIIAFIFMFGLLVFIHELGHLIFAKRAGMLAREFAIGFGPKIFSHRKDETLYTIRMLPIGGYVRVAGDDPEIVELKPGYHIGIEFNEQNKVNKIIVNNKSNHPNAKVVEVEQIDLDHDLTLLCHDLNTEERQQYDIDRKALFVMDEKETFDCSIRSSIRFKVSWKESNASICWSIDELLARYRHILGTWFYSGSTC